MKNKIKFAVLTLAALVGVAVFVPNYAHADPINDISQGVNDAGGAGQIGQKSLGDRIKTIVNILLYLLGAIAVVMIVIGGIRYATSNGDASAVTSAKNTILYAVIGLVVAILAYAIVNFVIKAFK